MATLPERLTKLEGEMTQHRKELNGHEVRINGHDTKFSELATERARVAGGAYVANIVGGLIVSAAVLFGNRVTNAGVEALETKIVKAVQASIAAGAPPVGPTRK